MKTLKTSAVLSLCAILLLTGCVASVGGGGKMTVNHPTLGQQLIDLQNARNSGAITPTEYQQQRAKLLEQK